MIDLLTALEAVETELNALERRAAELLSHNARHILFELCEDNFAWGRDGHDYLNLDPWHDRDAKEELVDAKMIEYGEPNGLDGLGYKSLHITRFGRAVSRHCWTLLREAHYPPQAPPSPSQEKSDE